MKPVLIALFTLLAATSAFAENRCQTAVEKQNPELAEESRATPEHKSNIADRIEQGETTLDRAEAKEVLKLLDRSGTLAYTFSNDAGIWLSIASSSCKVLYTLKIIDI